MSNIFIVNFELELYRFDNIVKIINYDEKTDIMKRNILTENEKKILLKNVNNEIKNNKIYMWLYYSASKIMKNITMEILEEMTCKFNNNIMELKCTVKYITDFLISDKELIYEIDAIFLHWRNSGDFSLELKKCQL